MYRRLIVPTALFHGLVLLAALAVLGGCARAPAPRLFPQAPSDVTRQTDALLPADVILLGEQHDAAEHQAIHRDVIEHLAVRGQLGAVALEMADAGRSTASLKSNSTQLQVQAALGWSDKAWPWDSYGPAVMVAVKAGVQVLGANLPAGQMREAMADGRLDQQLRAPALETQRELMRSSHCGLLPESQLAPMARIQIARDMSMARTIAQAALPGKVVVLIAGSGHVDLSLGVPQHLPTGLLVKAVQLKAGEAGPAGTAFDAVWTTPPLPPKDYCQALRK